MSTPTPAPLVVSRSTFDRLVRAYYLTVDSREGMVFAEVAGIDIAAISPTSCHECTSAAAEAGEENVSWWCGMFGCEDCAKAHRVCEASA